MTRLEVETDDFVTAAHLMNDHVGDPVSVASARLIDLLDDCTGMAGEDEGGWAWAMDYDDAARAVTHATNRLAAAAYATTNVFSQAATNYAATEHASTPGGSGQPIAQRLPPESYLGPSRTPMSAAGAGATEPSLWGFVKHLVGYVWPDGHQDRLRRAATGYRHCAKVLENAQGRPAVIMLQFGTDQLPEQSDINTVCTDISDRAEHLAHAHHQLAEACEQMAQHLDTCHSEIISELVILAEESALIETVGGIVSAFTFGVAEIPTQAAEAARITAAAAKITDIITRLYRAMRALQAAMPALTAAVEIDIVALDRIAKLETIAANVRQAGTTNKVHMNTPATGATAAAAAGRLEIAGTNERIKRPMNKKERRHVLDGDATGGGHRWPGKKGHTPFPPSWSDEQIVANIEDIITSDETQWYAETGNGGVRTKRGAPARWRAWEVRDGERILVVWEPAIGHIVTAFPDPDRTPVGVAIP